MIDRIFLVAARDFVATVSSRAFVVGLLMMPIIFLLVTVIVPRLLSAGGPRSGVRSR